MAPEPLSYVAAVVAHFVKRRGRGATVSAADLAWVVKWESGGVPLSAAVRGIDDAFRKDGALRSLSQCRWAVAAAAKRTAGGRDEARAAGPSLADRLQALAAALEAAAARVAPEFGPAAAAALVEGAARVRRLETTAAEGEEIARALVEVETATLDAVAAALPPAWTAAVDGDIMRELAAVDMTAATRRATARAVKRQRLRERLRLPRFL